MRIRRLIAAMSAASFCLSAQASIQTDMQNFFNSLGTYGNVTGAQVLQGQTGTTFAGGSLYMRTPQRNYNLFGLAPPSIKAGCGGIDLFAGSFYFMNAEQLTALLQNLANNAIGVAFELAIESISPELGSILKWAQDQASKLNSLNINSCQLATGLVTAAWPDQDVSQRVAARKGLDPQYNFSSDSLRSWWNQLTNPPTQTASETNAIVAADPRTKEAIDNINVVWNALSRLGITDQELRELMMSLTGTVVILRNRTDDSKPELRYVAPPQKIAFKTLIGDPASDTTNIQIMTCPDTDCLSPGVGNTTAASFASFTRNKIRTIIAKISGRTASALSSDEYKFLQGSFVPIWKIVAMADNVHADMLLDALSQLIAMDLALSYLTEIATELRKALANTSVATDSTTTKEQLEKFMDRLAEVRREAFNELSTEAQRVSSLLSMQQSLARIDYELKRGMSAGLRLSLETFNRR